MTEAQLVTLVDTVLLVGAGYVLGRLLRPYRLPWYVGLLVLVLLLTFHDLFHRGHL